MHGLGMIKQLNRIADAKAKRQLAEEQRDSVAKPGETKEEREKRMDEEAGLKHVPSDGLDGFTSWAGQPQRPTHND